MIFGRNIDNNCMIDFYEMTSDNVQGNTLMQRKLLSVLKSVLKKSTLQYYKRNIFIKDHASYWIIPYFWRRCLNQ